MDRAFQGEGRL